MSKISSNQKTKKIDRWKEIERKYFEEVDKLDDDTGYFDHYFVLNFFKKICQK